MGFHTSLGERDISEHEIRLFLEGFSLQTALCAEAE